MRRARVVSVLLCTILGCGGETVTTSPPQVAGVPGTLGTPERWYAAPDGQPDGNGTLEHPWSLDSALAGGRRVAGARPVGAADTIFLRGGTYVGRFNLTVGGAPDARIVVAPYPGEHAVLDGNDGQGASATVLAIQLPWVEVRGLEIMHGNPNRTAALPNLVSNYASHNRFVALELHDGGIGFFNEHDATDVEISGCLVYHNGWYEGGDGHGHGLYLKSDAGPVTARGNVVFDNFGFGIQAYSERLSTGIDSVVLDGNVVFNNSLVHAGHLSANILLGGVSPYGTVTRSVVTQNLAYLAPGAPTSNVKIGYDTTRNRGAAVTGNVVAGGVVVLDVHNWDAATITGDTIIGDPGDTSRVIQLTEGAVRNFGWSGNGYWNVGASSRRWRFLGTSYDFAEWLGRTSFAGDSVVSGAPPATRRAWWEPGRLIVAAYNESASALTVTVPDGVLAPGDSFAVRNVQRLDLPPVLAGRYSGAPLPVPLAAVQPAAPRNWSSAGPGTGNSLHAFLVTRVR